MTGRIWFIFPFLLQGACSGKVGLTGRIFYSRVRVSRVRVSRVRVSRVRISRVRVSRVRVSRVHVSRVHVSRVRSSRGRRASLLLPGASGPDLLQGAILQGAFEPRQGTLLLRVRLGRGGEFGILMSFNVMVEIAGIRIAILGALHGYLAPRQRVSSGHTWTIVDLACRWPSEGLTASSR